MRPIHLGLIALAAAASPGCVIKDNGSMGTGTQVAGDITFQWSFDGASCRQATEVQTVHLTITGPRGPELLDANGVYQCSPAGADAIRLRSFDPGNYTFTIDGLDSTGETIYTATGSAHVDGDIAVPVTLHRVNLKGTVQIYWSFGASKKACKDAGLAGPEGVSEVSVAVDGLTPQTFACTDTSSGQAVEGIAVKLDPGTHLLQVNGTIAHLESGQTVKEVWYAASPSVIVTAGQTLALPVALDAVAAQATFVPTLDVQGTPFSCTAANVKTLFIAVYDAANNCYPQNAGQCGWFDDCAKFETAGFYFRYVPVQGTFDSQARVWSEQWRAKIQGWATASSNPVVLYEGSAPALIDAATDARYFVPMVKK